VLTILSAIFKPNCAENAQDFLFHTTKFITMKRLALLIAILTFIVQTAVAQLELTPNGVYIIVAPTSASPTPFVMDMKYLALIGMPPASYVPFTVVGLPTATGGVIVLPPMPMTPSSSKTATVNIPPNTPAGSTFTITVTATKDGGLTTSTNFITVTTRAPTLAVDIVAINAKSSQGKNTLTWATASEKDNNKFVIERSVNGVDFTAVGEVKAAGTSQTVSNYSFLDENVTGSVNYYRIQSVDRAGRMNASKVVAVASKSALAAKVVGSQLNIVSDVEGQATVNVFNLSGQVVATQQTTLSVGLNVLSLNVSSLSSGIYFIKINSDYTHFVKQ
jgi:Secretion system C-terminal sorting domain